MSVVLDDALSQGLYISEALAAAASITMVAWFKSDDLTASQTLVSICDASADTEYFALNLRGDIANDYIHANARAGASNVNAITTVGYSSGTWHLASAVFVNQNSRDAMIDGSNEGHETTVGIVPANLDKTAVGYLARLSATAYTSGKIAKVAIWDKALTDAEILSIANGADPSSIQVGNLLAYWPLYDDADDESGNSKDLTLLNSPTFDNGDHPGVGSEAHVEGTKTVTGVAIISLEIQSYLGQGESGWPIARPSGYGPNLYWDEESETWGSTYVTMPGSRVEYTLVIGEEGEIYFGTV